MKKLIIIIIVSCIQLCYSFNTLSQNKKYSSIEEYVFNQAKFIFEGKVIESTSFIDTNNFNKIYSSYNIQIIKIFRGEGNINYGTIELIREGGWIPKQIKDTNAKQIKRPARDIVTFDGHEQTIHDGIFFCIPTNYPSLNRIVVNSIQIKSIGQIYNMYGLGRRFQSKQEIYDFLARHENITIPPEPEKKKEEEKPQFTQAQLDSIHRADSTTKEENRKLYEQRKKNHDQYMEYIQQKMKIAEENRKKKNAEGKKEDE